MSSSEFLCGDSASDESIDRAREWVRACDKYHKCYSINNATYLPKRLIDVSEIWRSVTPGVKLAQPTSQQSGSYVCLSHCWGSVPIRCCTTNESLAEAMNFLQFEDLPKNFQDAIILTRKLGVRYIWIDSICIVQNNTKDWETESAEMATIYSNAYLTIASSKSPDSIGGCFSISKADLKLSHMNEKLGSIVIGARMCDFDGRPSRFYDIQTRFPLFQRAWVFQERLLSRRILYCNFGELSLDCLEDTQCECKCRDLPPHPLHGSVLPNYRVNPKVRLLLTRNKKTAKNGVDVLHYRWRETISAYMNLNLTNANDVLPALSGCAKIFSHLLEDQYLAGMWRGSFAEDLAWSVKVRVDATEPKASESSAARTLRSRLLPKSRTQPPTVPSWSWASVSVGQLIHFTQTRGTRPLKSETILKNFKWNVECKPSGSNGLGALCLGSGILRIEAPILPCFIRRFCRRNIESICPSKTTGGRHTIAKRYNIYHRHERYHPELECSIPVPELDSRDGSFRFWPDVPPADELQFDQFQNCKYCGLARVWLFHVYRTWNDTDCQDYFMMLKNIDIDRNQFQRFGMVCFGGHTLDDRKVWFKEVWERSTMPKEWFSIV
jgi:hypothetical protein